MRFPFDPAPVNLSLASLPGLYWQRLPTACHEVWVDPTLGQISIDHVQLVPQCLGVLDDDLCDMLRCALPATQFRLHANVRVLPERRLFDLSTLATSWPWFERIGMLSHRLGACAYTAHPGRRRDTTLRQVLDNARMLADRFGFAVGVEGMYPGEAGWLLSTWSEYAELLESGVPYALDLSHLHIVATSSGQKNESLVQELLAGEQCLEIHVSHNDGSVDQHRPVPGVVWWLPLLRHAHPCSVIFTEGNLLRNGPV